MIKHFFSKNAPLLENSTNLPFKTMPAIKLLQDDIYTKQIKQLKELLSVTKEIYDEYYLSPLFQLASMAQYLPSIEKGSYHVKGGFLQLTLQRTIFALKYRRSLMLPIGGTPEAQYREHDIWSYAIYTASLLRDCWKLFSAYSVYLNDSANQQKVWHPFSGSMPTDSLYQFNLSENINEEIKSSLNSMFAGQVLNQKAFAWLQQAPHIFREWLACISFTTDKSIITELVNKAQGALLLPNQAISTTIEQCSSMKETTDSYILKEVDDNKSDSSATNEISLSELFLNWLKKELVLGNINCNQENSMLYQTEEGTLVLMPTVLEFFATNHKKLLNAQAKTLVDIQTSVMNSNYVLLNQNQADGLYQYYLGEWKARNVIRGFLLKPKFLFPEDEVVSVHPDCHLDLS